MPEASASAARAGSHVADTHICSQTRLAGAFDGVRDSGQFFRAVLGVWGRCVDAGWDWLGHLRRWSRRLFRFTAATLARCPTAIRWRRPRRNGAYYPRPRVPGRAIVGGKL